ncbi:hypothetical protein F2P81_025212 [Scophthalmus maximus]|uniref:GRAM domain-containing protein n=1 Tax=Scophthalmus maximus TaxID=52904 RepID=A0A6A4RJG5_SCOMX|nr:hypothetical protein F2P81_025212 [Scophthalmus maximus]
MENYCSADELLPFKRRSTMSKLSRSSGPAPRHRSDIENMVEELQRNGRTVSEQDQELSGQRKPALVRSRTFDHSLLTQVQTDCDSKTDRKKSHYSQSNCQYHKIFKEISKEEQLRQSYTCALQKDILYQGRMFLSDHWICFHSKVFGKDTKIAIPVVSVNQIKKTKTAILVPNALVIATANDRYVFVSLMSRDNTYKILMSICLHLEQSFSGDFVDLDGAVRQRRQETEESSSSDSQTADYEKLAEFPVPPFLDVLKHTDRAEHPDQNQNQHQNQNQNQNQNQHQNQNQNQNQHQHQHQKNSDNKKHETRHAGSDVLNLKPVSLNTLLFVYLLL